MASIHKILSGGHFNSAIDPGFMHAEKSRGRIFFHETRITDPCTTGRVRKCKLCSCVLAKETDITSFILFYLYLYFSFLYYYCHLLSRMHAMSSPTLTVVALCLVAVIDETGISGDCFPARRKLPVYLCTRNGVCVWEKTVKINQVNARQLLLVESPRILPDGEI